MNATPYYVIWDTSLGCWYGGSERYTQSFNRDKTIEFCAGLYPNYGHRFMVIESSGEPWHERIIYRGPEGEQ